MTYKDENIKWEAIHLRADAKHSADSKRRVSEISLLDDHLNEYQKDVFTILHSDEFRRLRLKTQVFSAYDTQQNTRTRLTHSLEVSNVARTVARGIHVNEYLCEAIALGHDLGHTPYGHAGERALNKCLGGSNDVEKFSHNVQSVWLISTHPQHKTSSEGSPIYDFNLTADVIEGVWKHRSFAGTKNQIPYLRYYNPNKEPSLEAQVVKKADQIAYLYHDINDACKKKIIKLNNFIDFWKHCTSFPFPKEPWDGILISDLITNNQHTPSIKYSDEVGQLYEEIKKYALDNILTAQSIVEEDAFSEEKIATIFDYYIGNIGKLRKKSYFNGSFYAKAKDDRIVIDYIQWLSDSFADNEYNRIVKKQST